MEKALPLWIVFATVLVPTLAATAPTPRAALGRCLVGIVVCNVLYLASLALVLPALS